MPSSLPARCLLMAMNFGAYAPRDLLSVRQLKFAVLTASKCVAATFAALSLCPKKSLCSSQSASSRSCTRVLLDHLNSCLRSRTCKVALKYPFNCDYIRLFCKSESILLRSMYVMKIFVQDCCINRTKNVLCRHIRSVA